MSYVRSNLNRESEPELRLYMTKIVTKKGPY